MSDPIPSSCASGLHNMSCDHGVWKCVYCDWSPPPWLARLMEKGGRPLRDDDYVFLANEEPPVNDRSDYIAVIEPRRRTDAEG